MISYQRPGPDGWRYSVGYRTRREGKDWRVERWNGSEWELVDHVWSYYAARCIELTHWT